MALYQALLIKNQQTVQKQLQPAQQTQSKTTQEQLLRHEQSLELVQTLLGASIGCLSFLRGLLPEECFVERRYGGKSSAVTSYRSFTSDIDEKDYLKKSKSDSGIRVKRLRRGYSGEADQLLDWLETGIFDALEKKYLKAVQLGIYVDKDHPDIIVEAYTFSFSYCDNEDGMSAISMKITNNAGHGITMNDANKSLQQMMRRLIVITQNLPPLPDKRWLTIRLHYRDHTPKDYDPPDFARLTTNAPALRFCESENQEVEKMDCGGLNAGYHAVSLKISSLQEANSQKPPKRRYLSRFVHADIDIEPPQFVPLECPLSKISRDLKSIIPSESTNNLRGKPKSTTETTCDSETSTKSMETVTKGKDSKRDTREKDILRGMLVSEARKRDLVETQPLEPSEPSQHAGPNGTPSNSRNPTHFTSSGLQALIQNNPGSLVALEGRSTVPVIFPVSTPRKSSIFPPGTIISQKMVKNQVKWNNSVKPSARVNEVLASVGKSMAKLKISKAKAEELRKDKKRDLNTKVTENFNKGKENNESQSRKNSITCECGDERDLGGMICCDNCDGWLHVNCYGFLSEKDTRIPDYHVCYTCLLGKNEGKLLEEMRGLALFRRALKKTWDNGTFPTSNKVFSGMIGCDLPTALQITKRLEEEGFITANITSRSGRSQKMVTSGAVRYKVVKTTETKRAMETQYFDPLAGIFHHYEFPMAMDLDHTLPEDSSVLPELLPYTEPTNTADAISEDTQEAGNTTEEAIFVLQKNVNSRDLDADSTDDEDMPEVLSTPFRNPPKPTSESRSPEILDKVSMLERATLEIPETPEAMDLDDTVNVEEVCSKGRDSNVAAPKSSQKSRISEVKQNLYVGIEDDC